MNPYYDNRLRSDKPITFLGFIDILRQLWESAGKECDIVRNSPFSLDTEENNFPLITYKLLKREVNPEFKEIKPKLRTTIEHPYIPNEWIELYGQMFDVYVEFDVYSLSDEEADELVMELDDFLQLYAGFFQQQGVQHLQFLKQEEDEVLSVSNYSVAKRPLYYLFRFEKITPNFLNQIQQLAVQAKVFHTLENQETEEES